MPGGTLYITMKHEQLVKKVKLIITQLIDSGERPSIKISVYLAKEAGLNYTYLSNVFSEVSGITIERFYIECKVEKAKEWLQHTDEPIYEIASRLHYCSKGHFSTQFKSVAGINPSVYRLNSKRSIDNTD